MVREIVLIHVFNIYLEMGIHMIQNVYKQDIYKL